MPSAGGPAERLTRNAGLLARESADGKTLFYTQRDGISPPFSLVLDGGLERQLVDCVLSRSLADGPDGMYYLGCPVGQSDPPLYRLDPATGRSRLLGKPEGGGNHPQLAVSPDGKTAHGSKAPGRFESSHWGGPLGLADPVGLQKLDD